MLVHTAKDRFTKGPNINQHLVDSLTQTPEKTITRSGRPRNNLKAAYSGRFGFGGYSTGRSFLGN